MRKETARQAYIRLLRNRIDAVDDLPSGKRETVLWADLIAGGYLDGETRPDTNGLPAGNVIKGATVKGRLFLQELELREQEERLQSRLLRHSLPVITFFAGILSTVFVEWLKNCLGL